MKDIVSKMLDERLFDAAVADRVRALMTEGKPLDEALLEASGLPEDKVLRYLAAEFQVPVRGPGEIAAGQGIPARSSRPASCSSTACCRWKRPAAKCWR